MRKAVSLVLLLLLCFSQALAVSPNRLREIAELVYSYFPPVEGFVVGVSHGIAVIDLGVKNRVYPGMVLTVSEKGLPFRNPITGEIIGYTEKVVGYLQVLEPYPTASYCRVYPLPGERIKAGDIVRITRARVNLFILPIVDNTGEGFNILAFSDSLRKYLEKTGRFNVMGEERVIQEVSAYKGSFQEEGVLSTFYSLYKGKNEAFFALYGRIEKRSGRYFFVGDIFCLNIAKRVKHFSVYLGEAGWKPSFEEDVVYASAPVEGKGYAVGVGDVNGDGVKDVVFVVSNVVRVLSYDASKGTYREIASSRVPLTFKVYQIDVRDVDGDGKEEVFLSGSDIRDYTISTFVFKYEDNELSRKAKIDGYFVRVFASDFAVAQYLLKEDPLSVPPYLADVKNYSLKKRGRIEALKGNLVLGMVAFDGNGDGVRDYLVNEEGRLVLKDGKTAEILADVVGSYGNTGYAFFYREPQVKVFYEGEGFVEISKQDYARFKELTLAVPGSVGMDYVDGKPEIAVFANKPFVWSAYFEPFKSSVVKVYRWADGYFEDTGWVRMLPEGVVSVAMGDVNGDGVSEVVLLTLKGVRTRKEGLKFNSRLIIYKGPGR